MIADDQPQIIALFRSGGKGEAMEPLATGEVIADFGFAGDRKARPGSKRQVLLLDVETIEEFGFRPGDLDENITMHGLPINTLRRGQQLRIGDVILEITIECPACYKLEARRPGLEEAMRHRRGMMTRVLQGGSIRVGDAVELLASTEAGYEPAHPA